jgi:hypothetical protein
MGAVLKAAPGLAIAIVKLRRVAMFIGQVPRCKNLARDLLDEFSGSFGASEGSPATSDVARAYEGKHLVLSGLTRF